MTHEYIRQARHSYLILKDDSNAAHEASYQLAMLEKCPIDGLLSFSEGHLNESTVCQYDITSLKPLPVLASVSPFSEAAIRKLFSGLLKTVEMVEDCLLSADHLLLDPNYCYLDSDIGSMILKIPYVPFYHQDIFKSLADFSTYLATHAAKEDPNAVVLACRIRHDLQEPNVVLNDLKPYLRFEDSEYSDMHEDFSGGESAQAASWNIPPHSNKITGGSSCEISQKSGRRSAHPFSALKDQLPERFTILAAIGVIPAAVLFYFLLHFYAFWSMTASEQVLVSVISAALVIFLICMAKRILAAKRKGKDTHAQSAFPSDTVSGPSDDGSFSKEPESPTDYSQQYPLENEPEEEHTMLLSDYLSSQKTAHPRLVPETTVSGSPEDHSSNSPAVIDFDHTRFLIGSSDVLCDKVIDDPTVSRIHAEIIEIEGRWYLFDMNSKNGTFLGRTMVPAEKKVPLKDGDTVIFGAAHYIFRE